MERNTIFFKWNDYLFLVESPHIILRDWLQWVHSLLNKLTMKWFNSYIHRVITSDLELLVKPNALLCVLFRKSLTIERESLLNITSWYSTLQVDSWHHELILDIVSWFLTLWLFFGKYWHSDFIILMSS